MRSRLNHIVQQLVTRPKRIAPLVTFRILFGALMAFGAIRFMLQGWVEKLYGEPVFFFKYPGFQWVPVLDTTGMYAVYTIMATGALLIMLGLWYRLGAVLFFLTFTYAELTDLTNYLNHYYLVILLSFWLIFLPAHRRFALDVWRKPHWQKTHVPAWCIHVLIAQLAIVYFYAGVAKLQPDWLLRAMPLAVWLPEHQHLPILGRFFALPDLPFLFSWFGAFYDLTIPFWLLWRPSRPLAYAAVVVFHALTGILFNIGLFPLIMISSTLIFFPARSHERWLRHLGYAAGEYKHVYQIPAFAKKGVRVFLGLYLALQILFPLRHWLYPGSVLWTEEGYRFSWRVMVVEKNGHATFYVEDPATGRRSEVDHRTYLTPFQEKQLAIQPDFMLQFARFLQAEYRDKYHITNARVTVDSYVSLNGRSSQRFIDPDFDLASAKNGWQHRTWIRSLTQP